MSYFALSGVCRLSINNMNELDRLIELSEFNLDYTALDADLDDLTRLAARICGAEISLVNLIDRYNQWTIGRYALDITQMPREDSVCQYTIRENGPLELKELKQDPRLKDKDYVCGGSGLNYYYGVPLVTNNGAKIGALCVLDRKNLELTQEQSALLENVAQLVVRRLEAIKRIHQLQEHLNEANKSKRKVGHDVRGPISGILGLVHLLREDLKGREISDFGEMLTLIENSGESMLELADSILRTEDDHSDIDYNCEILAEKLEQLYAPQALSKKIKLSVEHHDDVAETTYFPPKALLQIGGNLINNALKFTPEGGAVSVRISAKMDEEESSGQLYLEVEDNGVGMSEERIQEILQGRAQSDAGTEGERGHGLGLPLVRQLVDKEEGDLNISSKPGEGCKLTVRLPI